VDAGCQNSRIAGRSGISILDIPFHRRTFKAPYLTASMPEIGCYVNQPTPVARPLPRRAGGSTSTTNSGTVPSSDEGTNFPTCVTADKTADGTMDPHIAVDPVTSHFWITT